MTSTTRPLILVVDDEPSIVSFVREALEDEGYTVATAQDGPSAITAARQSQPALVLVDMVMPSMSGVELIHQLLADPLIPPFTALMMSATPPPRIAETGAAGYIVKPFAVATLLELIDDILTDIAPNDPDAE